MWSPTIFKKFSPVITNVLVGPCSNHPTEGRRSEDPPAENRKPTLLYSKHTIAHEVWKIEQADKDSFST